MKNLARTGAFISGAAALLALTVGAGSAEAGDRSPGYNAFRQFQLASAEGWQSASDETKTENPKTDSSPSGCNNDEDTRVAAMPGQISQVAAAGVYQAYGPPIDLLRN